MIAGKPKTVALDPWLSELVRLAEAQPAPHTLPPQTARELVAARYGAAAEAVAAAARVRQVLDVSIPGPAGDLPARIYLPETPAPCPVTLYFHGGGFVLMGLQTHDGICRRLCELSGSGIVSVDYRLAPEHPFPAALDDAMAALQWAAREAAAFGADPARLAVAGDSAGGNLATVTALRARDEAGPALRAQLLFYPVVDCAGGESVWPSWSDHAKGVGLTADTMRWFRDLYLPSEGHWSHPHVSPIRAPGLHGLPPAHIATAGYDILRDEGEAYAAALAAAGVATTLTRYPSLNHAFLHWADHVDAAMDALRQAGRWLRFALDQPLVEGR
ncbi:MAG: alpha/beta hydrolase [Achromobacter veterisilvae]